MNSHAIKPNLFRMIGAIQDEENLTSVNYEKAHMGKAKSRKTKNELKDSKIENLKHKYIPGDIKMMDFLTEVSQFVADYD